MCELGICGWLIQRDFSNISSIIPKEIIIQASLEGEDHGDLVRISYQRYMRDMCEDLKGSYLVIMGSSWEWLRE